MQTPPLLWFFNSQSLILTRNRTFNYLKRSLQKSPRNLFFFSRSMLEYCLFIHKFLKLVIRFHTIEFFSNILKSASNFSIPSFFIFFSSYITFHHGLGINCYLCCSFLGDHRRTIREIPSCFTFRLPAICFVVWYINFWQFQVVSHCDHLLFYLLPYSYIL